MRTVVLRVVALALLLLLTLVTIVALRTLGRVPDTVIYFVGGDDAAFTLEPVNRRLGALPVGERTRAQVAALARGPSETEAARGLRTAVPAATAVLSAELDAAGVLVVDLTGAFAAGGGTATMTGRLAQLFYTLSQPSDVVAVELRLDGEPVTAFSGEGLVVPTPWVRAEHPGLPVW